MARSLVVLVAVSALACGGSRPPEAAHPEEPEVDAPEAPPAPAEPVIAPDGSRAPPPSTATYDEALATPERLDAQDTRAHLTDLQLTNPMRDVMGKCRVPKGAKVVTRVAVQHGRAIGVTVLVTFDKPKAGRPPTPAAARVEAKAKKRLSTCVDHAVRAVVWPPSSRRDSFTTEF